MTRSIDLLKLLLKVQVNQLCHCKMIFRVVTSSVLSIEE